MAMEVKCELRNGCVVCWIAIVVYFIKKSEIETFLKVLLLEKNPLSFEFMLITFKALNSKRLPLKTLYLIIAITATLITT